MFLQIQYNNDRKAAEEFSFTKLVNILGLKIPFEENLKFIMKNWCVLLLTYDQELRCNNGLKKILKRLFNLKAVGNEEDYIAELQRSIAIRKLLEKIVEENVG